MDHNQQNNATTSGGNIPQDAEGTNDQELTFEHDMISWKFTVKVPLDDLWANVPDIAFDFKIGQHPAKHISHPHEPNVIDHGKNILKCDNRPSSTESIRQPR